MPNLLLKITGNKLLNRSLFAHTLYIYDEYITYHKRDWFMVKEVSISYPQIAQVNLVTGILFGQLDFVGTSDEDLQIRFVPKGEAKKAKRIVDQKIHHAHLLKRGEFKPTIETLGIGKLEKSLSRLRELLQNGRISKAEYEKERNHLLKNV